MERKKRCDRNHIVYMLVLNGLRYVGVTAKTDTTVAKSVYSRRNKHWYRRLEDKGWKLYEEMRKLSDREEIEVYVLDIVRGKEAGHKREVELRRELQPELNTDVR